MRTIILPVHSLVAILLLWLTGCLAVNPSNVNVNVGGFGSPRRDTPPRTPYASALRDAIEQQGAVRVQLNDGDWADAADEVNDWLQYTRTLLGHAETSHDPAKFRAYGNELLAAIERLRQAIARHDMRASQDALRACDPILDKLSRDFPLTAPSPCPAASPSNNQAPPPRSSADRVP
ncbi:MAG TPA: hypothetical protein VLM89_16705 [Phycisphaerae bacterium]|nr:hypothetical protein [Phycisphaerae bacterium]